MSPQPAFKFRKATLTGRTYLGQPLADLDGYASPNFHISKTHYNACYVQHPQSDCRVAYLERRTLSETKAAVVAAEAAFKWIGKNINEVAAANGMDPETFARAVKDRLSSQSARA